MLVDAAAVDLFNYLIIYLFICFYFFYKLHTGRPRVPVHADDAARRVRHAGLCTHRCSSQHCLCRLQCRGAAFAYQQCELPVCHHCGPGWLWIECEVKEMWKRV